MCKGRGIDDEERRDEGRRGRVQLERELSDIAEKFHH